MSNVKLFFNFNQYIIYRRDPSQRYNCYKLLRHPFILEEKNGIEMKTRRLSVITEANEGSFSPNPSNENIKINKNFK